MTVSLDLQLASERTDTPSIELLERWVAAALREHPDNAEVSIRIVDEDESQALNHQYRGKNHPTNVLSFPFDLPPGIPASEIDHLLGDLVICAPVVAEESEQQNKPLNHHWAHMIVHGVLHLLGFDHINDKDAEQMEQMEREILARLSIPDPYQQD